MGTQRLVEWRGNNDSSNGFGSLGTLRMIFVMGSPSGVTECCP